VIWIILAVLGVPIWLVVGLLLGALWSRRRFRRTPGVFACKIRSAAGDGGSEGWPRTTSYARWVHDVLLVHGGIALVRNRALPVRSVEGAMAPAPNVKMKGSEPVSVTFRLDDDSIVEVAAFERDLLAGPFDALRAKPTEPAR
jgi:hypothetical protein